MMTCRLMSPMVVAATILLASAATFADDFADTRARDDEYIRRQQEFAAGRAQGGAQEQTHAPAVQHQQRVEERGPGKKPTSATTQSGKRLSDDGATARDAGYRAAVDDLWHVNWKARRCDPSVNTLDQARTVMSRMCQSLGPAQTMTDEVPRVVRFVCAKRPYPFGPVAWLAHGRAACEAKLAYLRLAYPLADSEDSSGSRSGVGVGRPAPLGEKSRSPEQDEEDPTEE